SRAWRSLYHLDQADDPALDQLVGDDDEEQRTDHHGRAEERRRHAPRGRSPRRAQLALDPALREVDVLVHAATSAFSLSTLTSPSPRRDVSGKPRAMRTAPSGTAGSTRATRRASPPPWRTRTRPPAARPSAASVVAL